VAQLVARLLWEQEVRGSSPRTPTTRGSNSVVEFLPSKQAVASSNLVSRFFVGTVSFLALDRPLQKKQAVKIPGRDGFSFAQKAFNECLPHFMASPCLGRYENLPMSDKEHLSRTLWGPAYE
jgi:hypothetical protein